MNYEGKLWGRVAGEWIPMQLTTVEIDEMIANIKIILANHNKTSFGILLQPKANEALNNLSNILKEQENDNK